MQKLVFLSNIYKDYTYIRKDLVKKNGDKKKKNSKLKYTQQVNQTIKEMLGENVSRAKLGLGVVIKLIYH